MPVAASPWAVGFVGWPYLAVSQILTGIFLYYAVLVLRDGGGPRWREPDEQRARPEGLPLLAALPFPALRSARHLPARRVIMTAYDRLAARFARIATVGEAIAMLSWDASVMMPPGGAATRGDQLAVLSGLVHELTTARQLGDDLAEAEQAPPAEPWAAANLRLMRHRYLQSVALPSDLVEARSRANSACESIWRVARPASDFDSVRPALEEVVRLTREAGVALGEAFQLSPYDALMDGFQRGVRAGRCRTDICGVRGVPG